MNQQQTNLSILLGALVLGASAIYYNRDLLSWPYKTTSRVVPEDAPEECPGLGSETAGKADACSGCPNRSVCATGAQSNAPDPALQEVKEALKGVKNVLLVLSGKGGVGKSTVSSQLAWTLSNQGNRVSLLDIDICGPSIPTMFGLQNAEVHPSAEGWEPVYVTDNLALMSIGFLLSDQDDAIVWRGPKKNGLIRQFLSTVLWGDCDYLIIDTPPGTSDEHLSLVTYLKEVGVTKALLVTTPQEVALADVRKEAKFCEKVGIDMIGVVENMTNSVFDNNGNDSGHVEKWCKEKGYDLLSKIPLESSVRTSCDKGIHQQEDMKIFRELSQVVEAKIRQMNK